MQLQEIKNKAKYVAAVIGEEKDRLVYGTLLAMTTNPTMVFADTELNDSTTMITQFVNLLASVISGIGAIFVLTGLWNLITAIRNEDAERQTKAITNLIIGALMVGIKPVYNYITQGTAVGITLT